VCVTASEKISVQSKIFRFHGDGSSKTNDQVDSEDENLPRGGEAGDRNVKLGESALTSLYLGSVESENPLENPSGRASPSTLNPDAEVTSDERCDR